MILRSYLGSTATRERVELGLGVIFCLGSSKKFRMTETDVGSTSFSPSRTPKNAAVGEDGLGLRLDVGLCGAGTKARPRRMRNRRSLFI